MTATGPLPPIPPTPGPPRLRIGELRSVAITGLFVLAVLYTLHLAKDLILPICLALLLALILQPVVRLLRGLRIPAPFAPALVLLLLLAGAGTAAWQLWTPAAEWVARAPQDLRKLETRAKRLLRSFEGVTRTAEQVDQITGDDTPEVALRQPSLSAAILGGAWRLLATGLIVVVLTYFLLTMGEQLLRKLPRILPRAHAEGIVATLQEAELQISRYLLSITVINLGVGLLVAGLMAIVGMPTPFLLGATAAAANFVPYLGPFCMAALLVMVALISFDQPTHVVLAPAVYLMVHALEANLVTPHLLGRRLPLNPLAIFLGFVFWWWIWGVPGAMLAVPIMVTVKLICDRTERLAGIGEVLGR